MIPFLLNVAQLVVAILAGATFTHHIARGNWLGAIVMLLCLILMAVLFVATVQA